jgi:hypothetical protein
MMTLLSTKKCGFHRRRGVLIAGSKDDSSGEMNGRFISELAIFASAQS